MHVGTDFLKLPPVTGQYWSLFQCSMLGTGGTCGSHNLSMAVTPGIPPAGIGKKSCVMPVGAIFYAPGIEPTLSGTKPPYTSPFTRGQKSNIPGAAGHSAVPNPPRGSNHPM